MSAGPSAPASDASFTGWPRDGFALYGSRHASSAAAAELLISQPPPSAEPEASGIAHLHAQLDSISSETVVLSRFQLLGAAHRVTGSAPPRSTLSPACSARRLP